ncbi:hypothetical protein DM45_2989 [Burkholderia mallei]|nr:hypothetical protein X977_5408 [Burkholderia pseudomallei MSHR7504]KGS61358.1 hypothetical protein X990_5279 [Burkholderia pseudomallei MSHR4868]KOS92248.1 hypothetical protein DM45_2989 [Burkholderia mallei]KOT08334.1 hypothetical protein DM77_2382 [Burkholderia mallei]
MRLSFCQAADIQPIKKRSRFLPTIQCGGLPRPLHVLPDFGSRYLAGSGPFFGGRPRRARSANPKSCAVSPYSAILPCNSATTAAIS